MGLSKKAADDRGREDHHADQEQPGNYLLAQSDAARSAALIEFGGPHSSDPECPGAQRIALINRPIDATRLP
jgi:hypothetical protein